MKLKVHTLMDRWPTRSQWTTNRRVSISSPQESVSVLTLFLMRLCSTRADSNWPTINSAYKGMQRFCLWTIIGLVLSVEPRKRTKTLVILALEDWLFTTLFWPILYPERNPLSVLVAVLYSSPSNVLNFHFFFLKERICWAAGEIWLQR